MKLLVFSFLFLIAGVLLGYVGLGSSESEKALLYLEDEASSYSSKELITLVLPNDYEQLSKNRRVEVSTSELFVEHYLPKEDLDSLRKEIKDLLFRFELLTVMCDEQTVKLDDTLDLLSFYKSLCGENLAREFRETRKIANELNWQELGLLDVLFKNLARIDFSDEDLREYTKNYFAHVENVRLLRIERYNVTNGDLNHKSNAEFNERQIKNSADYLHKLRLLFNDSDIRKILGVEEISSYLQM
jgi:hypothetical protein